MARLPGYGTVRTAWVPVASVTAFPVITAAMVTGGTDLTFFELPDSSVRADASDTITENAIGDVAKTDVPTFGKYTGSLHLFRSYTPGAATVATDDLLTTFKGRPIGYYIRRIGKANTAAFAATDVVEAYLFQADDIQIEANDGGNIKMTVPLLQRGVYRLDIALT